MDDAETAELIRRAKLGDRTALGDLLNAHRDYLRRLADGQLDSRLHARLDASDLVQQTCLSVHKRIAEFDGVEVPQFIAWLKQVHVHNVQNAIRDQLQAGKRAASREQPAINPSHAPAESPTPSQRAVHGEEAARLSKALARLPDDQHKVLRLRYLEGRTVADISGEMGITRDALVWLLKKAMQNVRDHLASPP